MRKIIDCARMGIIAAGMLTLTSCADMDQTQQRMVSGGAVGAVVGTVGTAMTGGCIPCGTAIGGAVGVAGGYLVDQIDKNTKSGSSATSYGNAPPPNSSAPTSYSTNPP